uniref:Homeodomain-interacting protein kinase 1-like n=1 Tax=Oryzias melastigma TaxID=30732 RepID=A0A3B3CHE4_ORYME
MATTSNSAQYLVEKLLGEGAYGKVAKCRNLTTKQEVAVKIIKPSDRDSALAELHALDKMTNLDADKYGLIKFLDWFEYRGHICIVFELLDQSLYGFMKARKRRPLLIHEIRTIARQLLTSLKGLKEINMAHCDIKPDNIMLVNQASEPFRVKLIDFGLAINPKYMETGTLMQVLQYRAPEVILGLPLDERVDMWTVGYNLAWLYTGFHIHPVDSEYTIITSLTMRQGMPDQNLLNKGKFTSRFFSLTEDESKYVWELDTTEQQFQKTGKEVRFRRCCLCYDDLENFYQDKTKMSEVEQFVKLLSRMLEIDPNKRITPEEALKHSFFTMEQPSADSEKTNSQESASPEVPEQPTKTTVPQVPAAAPQEKSRIEIKEDAVQQQEAAKSNTQAGSRKRKRGVEQSQDPEHCSLPERAAKKPRIESKEDVIQPQVATKSNSPADSRKRKRSVEQSQGPEHSLVERAAKKPRIQTKEDVIQQQEAAKSNTQAGSRKRKHSVEQSQGPEQSSLPERAAKKSRIESKEDVLQQQVARKSNSPAGSRKRKHSAEQSQGPELSPQTKSPAKKMKTREFLLPASGNSSQAA